MTWHNLNGPGAFPTKAPQWDSITENKALAERNRVLEEEIVALKRKLRVVEERLRSRPCFVFEEQAGLLGSQNAALQDELYQLRKQCDAQRAEITAARKPAAPKRKPAKRAAKAAKKSRAKVSKGSRKK